MTDPTNLIDIPEQPPEDLSENGKMVYSALYVSMSMSSVLMRTLMGIQMLLDKAQAEGRITPEWLETFEKIIDMASDQTENLTEKVHGIGEQLAKLKEQQPE